MKRLSIIALFLVTTAAQGQGQFGGNIPVQPWQPTVPVAEFHPTPEQRRAERDQVLQKVGKEAAPFLKRHGDVAVAALKKCKPETGKRLLEVQWERLRAHAILEAIALHGEPVGMFVADRSGSLADPAVVSVFLNNPLDFAYDLRDLEQEAALARQTVAQPSADRTGDAAPASNSSMLALLVDWRILLCLLGAATLGFVSGAKARRRVA